MRNTKIGFIDDYDLDELFDSLEENVKGDTKSFEDLLNLDGCLNREIYLGDIVYGTGATIDGYIRFWNAYDDKHNIPVEERKPIKFYINSGGGSLTETFIMINAIEMSKTPVWTIVTGMAYSGGGFVAMRGHKRFAYKNASLMIHEGSTQTGGDSHKFRNYSLFYSHQMGQLKKHVLNCTKITEQEYDEHSRDDWWFDTDEAIKYGLIDEISEELI